MDKKLWFPDKFIWGAATSALQIEGACYEDGKGESIWDRFSQTPGKIRTGDTMDVACDHYHRWQQDIDLMADLGLKAYRFSISWPRVLPEGHGEINQKGADFYSRLVDGLLEKGIQPFTTLYHWDLPQALQDAGGWSNRRTIDWFTEYAVKMYELLGDRVQSWSTINEPNVFSRMGYQIGEHAPGVKDQATSLQVLHHLLLAHGDAVKAGRQLLPNAQFGIVPAIGHIYPATDSAADRAAAQKSWEFGYGWFLDPLLKGEYNEAVLAEYRREKLAPVILDGDLERISAPIDFLGINHYSSMFVQAGPDGKPVPVDKGYPKNDRGWPVVPHGFRDMLLHLKERYGDLPIYIMENGASYPDKVSPDGHVHDNDRVEYYDQYIRNLHQAVEGGVDVRGYFAWSLMDNFEFAWGYSSRFGIVYVDFLDGQKRIVKDSGLFYADIIRQNGLREPAVKACNE